MLRFDLPSTIYDYIQSVNGEASDGIHFFKYRFRDQFGWDAFGSTMQSGFTRTKEECYFKSEAIPTETTITCRRCGRTGAGRRTVHVLESQDVLEELFCLLCWEEVQAPIKAAIAAYTASYTALEKAQDRLRMAALRDAFTEKMKPLQKAAQAVQEAFTVQLSWDAFAAASPTDAAQIAQWRAFVLNTANWQEPPHTDIVEQTIDTDMVQSIIRQQYPTVQALYVAMGKKQRLYINKPNGQPLTDAQLAKVKELWSSFITRKAK